MGGCPHCCAGIGLQAGHRHPAAGAILEAGDYWRGSWLQTRRRKVGARPPACAGTKRPRLRSQRPCGSLGLSSALRLPPALLPPPASLARSLPPPGRLGADSAARCSRVWKMAGNDCGALLDEELSSFFLNYLADTQVPPAGTAGPGPGVLSCGGCHRSRGGREAAVGSLRDRGFQAAEPPFHAPCDALCWGGAGSLRSPPRKPERWGRYGYWGGSSLGGLQSASPAGRAEGYRASLRWSRAKVSGTLRQALRAGGAPSGSRHLLPYFHVDLWPRHRCPPPFSESPGSPVSSPHGGSPSAQWLLIRARSAEFPASCQLRA